MTVKVPDTAACLGCGYLLRSLPEPRCPEYGRMFIADKSQASLHGP